MTVYITKDAEITTGGSGYNFKTILKKGGTDLSQALVDQINAELPGVIGTEEDQVPEPQEVQPETGETEAPAEAEVPES